ncbi:MAG: shikimate kinase [Nitrospira sp.]|nr:shikimate kinase [Nitrospira sp.]MDH4371672.1 shikimate kinase [Nitrospira sp.]MDH5497545.1 shikimate kinase [Nitrospira sp.]MDH5726998.1 shikimate kinase [Nitrospira sp.]
MNNVVLIGYRGTGKSAVGRILASRLDRTLLSTDTEIVRLAGQTIPEIVEQHGWESFRDLESQICQQLTGRQGLVVDTGGGIILRPQNVAVLKQVGTVFWLTASVETIATRIGGDTQRPSLTVVKSFIDEIQEVLRERLPKYQSSADHVIETEGKSLRQVADDILARL